MKKPTLSWFMLIALSVRVSSGQIVFEDNDRRQQSSCRTVDGISCIFPFIFENVRYDGCTTVSDPDNLYWCSTKVDTNGVHVSGGRFYGHCADPECPKIKSPVIEIPQEFSQCSFNQNGLTVGGTCMPIALCSRLTLQEENSNLCNLGGEEGGGVCCPEILGSSVPVPIATTEITVEAPINVTLQDIDQRIASVFATRGSFFDDEEDVARENNFNFPGDGDEDGVTPTEFHLRFNQPRNDALNVDFAAAEFQDAALALRANHKLSDVEASIGLRMFDSDTSTSINQLCPWTPEPKCDARAKYRTANGVCNNLKEPNYGRSVTPFQRILPPQYSGSLQLPRKSVMSNKELPSAREISNRVTGSNNNIDKNLNVLLMQMGQFIDHDLTHTPNHGINCCGRGGSFPRSFNSKKCFPIPLGGNDPFWKGKRRCMNLARSLSAPGLKCEIEFRQQMNQLTHWLDASNIYASSQGDSDTLRQRVGGLLKISDQKGSKKGTLPSCSKAPSGVTMCQSCKKCFFAGDIRANEQINLLAMHSLWLREHNRIAGFLAKINPTWNDETLFQETRRIVIAEYQHIIYKEWIPSILGSNFMDSYGLWPLTKGYSNDYMPSFDPRITNEFATAAFRFGHSLIPGKFSMAAPNSRSARRTVEMQLRDLFFKPQRMTSAVVMDSLVKGMVSQKGSPWDSSFSSDIRNHLFESRSGAGGLDLVSINIQRGRDHGIQGYNAYREVCGSRKAKKFEDFADIISMPDIRRLKSMYDHVDDVDLFVGGFLEFAHGDSLIGPVFKCILGDQFARLKLGDRFFYDLGNDAMIRFTPAQLREIRKTSMARIICDNTDLITSIQPHAFQATEGSNREKSCRSASIPVVDLSTFRS